MPHPILIDTDPGQDDAVALLLALANRDALDLLGVTTVAGNVPIAQATANALRICDLAEADVPVYAGAERPLLFPLETAEFVCGPDGLAGADLPPPRRTAQCVHAVPFLVDTLRTAAVPVTLCALGPLTNLALALRIAPDISGRIERIVLMGGAIGVGNVTPAAEFNIWADPEAAARVFASGLDVTMIGLDVTHRALVGSAARERLRGSTAAGRLAAELLDFTDRFHRETYGWDASPVHDAVAVAHVVVPGLVETARRHVAVECASELCRGRTVVDLWRRTEHEPNAHVAVGVDGDAFVELLVERISSLG